MLHASLQPTSSKRPLQRVRRTISASLRLINSSGRVVDDAIQPGTRQPLRVTRRVQHAYGWLADASARLDRAVETLRKGGASPGDDPERVVGYWSAVWDQLDETFARLQSAVSGSLPAGAFVYRRPQTLRIPLRRMLAPKWPACEHVPLITIHVRRRRSAPAAAAEPPRRVSRGRAPPPLSFLPLLP